MKEVLLFVCFWISYQSFTQEKTDSISLGNGQVQLVKFVIPDAQVIYVNVHEDEQTSIRVLTKYSKRKKLNSLYLKHSAERRIEFTLNDSLYSIDPNRIFTKEGIRKTIDEVADANDDVVDHVAIFADELKKTITETQYKYVVTLHNNTPDHYSILSYLEGGGESANTKEVYVNEELDPDDFVYTTDTWMYEQLVKEEVNVILQDNLNAVNDGSLSVYCAFKYIPYVNIEAEHGHFRAQRKLLMKVRKLIKKKITNL